MLLLLISLPPVQAADPVVAAADYPTVAGDTAQVPMPNAKATVLVFVSSTCPIANGYAPEINRLTKEFGPKKIELLLVHTEETLSEADAKEHLEEYGYKCQILFDSDRKLVKQTGATITPEVAVISAEGKLLYRGRIDDRFPAIGIQREQPRKTELRDALNAILNNQPIAVTRTKATGCFIE